MYKIEADKGEIGPVERHPGSVKVLRDDRMIYEAEYDSEAERESILRLCEELVAAAEAPTPTRHDALEPSDAWTGGMALWGVLIREGYFRVLEPLRIFAASKEAALEYARRFVKAEEYLCVGMVAPAFKLAHAGGLGNHWCVGPEGWKRYDLRPYYAAFGSEPFRAVGSNAEGRA